MMIIYSYTLGLVCR